MNINETVEEDKEGQPLLTEQQIQQVLSNDQTLEWLKQQMYLHLMNQGREASSMTRNTNLQQPAFHDGEELDTTIALESQTTDQDNPTNPAPQAQAQAQEDEIHISPFSEMSLSVTRDEYQKLQQEMNAMQRKIDELEAQQGKQEEIANNDSDDENEPEAASGSNPSRTLSPFFTRNFTDKLPGDNFTLMMLSEPGNHTQPWVLGLATFLFQMVLGAIICADQIGESKGSSLFNVPFKVDGVVRAGQLMGIIFVLATQSDIITSIRSFVLFWKNTRWDRVILRASEDASPPSKMEWIRHILIPNGLKFIQGILVMFVTFVLIVQSDNTIELLKDFTALMVLSETDNITFHLAFYGYLGEHLHGQARYAQEIEIKRSDSPGDHNNSSRIVIHEEFHTRPLMLLFIMLCMISGWLGIVVNQVNGTYFEQRYPNCTDSIGETYFSLAFDHFGDGDCYGGPLNTLQCEFEGGDCVNVNLAFPLCKGDNFTQLYRLGDGHCDDDLNDILCDGDGGDCCPFEFFPKVDEIFINGQCDGGRANTKVCNYDSGECEEFNNNFPSCDIEELSKLPGSNGVVLGDGVCDSDIYASPECGFENGDCEFGRKGGNVKLDGIFGEQTFSDLRFEIVMSLDGDSVVATESSAPKVFRFNSTESNWVRVKQRQMDKKMVGDEIWRSIATSADGNRFAVGSPSNDQNGYESGQVKVFESSPDQQYWVQVGQTIDGVSERDNLGWKVGMVADGSKLVIVAPGNDIGGTNAGQLRIYEFDMDLLSWNQVGNSINGTESEDHIGEINLHLSASDGSRVLLSAKRGNSAVARVYNYDADVNEWAQIGDDIPSPYPGSSSISADGNRVAISSESTNEQARGRVQIFDFNRDTLEWNQIGDIIHSSTDRIGNGFGYSLVMSLDGNLLAIGSISQVCIRSYQELCPSGSVELFVFDPIYDNIFQTVIPTGYYPGVEGNIIKEIQFDRENSLFGLQMSMDKGGSLLSVSAFNIAKNVGYFKVYNLDELFYPRCAIPDPDEMGNGFCNENLPYNSADCAWDGGDCETGTLAPTGSPTVSSMPSYSTGLKPEPKPGPRPPTMAALFKVEKREKSSVPETPDGLKLSTNDVFSDTIPVLVREDRTFWAFSFRDNRFAFQIVAFDSSGVIVGEWYRPGSRYLDEIQIDEDSRSIVFVGQSAKTVSISFEDILSTMSPTISPRPSTSPTITPPTMSTPYSVVKVTKSSVPMTPEGLKITTWPDVSSRTIPVLKWEGETFWAFSFIDNRSAFQIVSFNSFGDIVREWFKPGARYLDEIQVNTSTGEVVFVGQSEFTVSLTFEEILTPSTIAPTVSPTKRSPPSSTSSLHSVLDVAKSSVPTTPEDLKLSTSPNFSSSTIPVLKWQDGTVFWAFSFRDNRLAFQIVAFNSNGNIIGEWYRPGARYLDEIRVDDAAEEVVFVGQSQFTVSLSFQEILKTVGPTYSVVDVAKSSVPMTPANLKISTSPNIFASTIPVLKWQDETFWAFSFIDNRNAFQIVSFDENGSMVREWYRPGARYLDVIEVDESAEEVVFVGQGGLQVKLTFIEIENEISPP